jgi:hypothetical protein
MRHDVNVNKKWSFLFLQVSSVQNATPLFRCSGRLMGRMNPYIKSKIREKKYQCKKWQVQTHSRLTKTNDTLLSLLYYSPFLLPQIHFIISLI